MKVEEMRWPGRLLVQTAGLTVTGALLLVIAISLQLCARLLSWGGLHPSLGVLAFGFLFYVFAAGVSAGTADLKQRPLFVIANVGLHAGFLAGAWLLWRATLTPAWLGLAIGWSALLHLGLCGFAALRERALAALLSHAAAHPAAAVEGTFHSHAAPFRAIPVGAALGALLGALGGAAGADLVRHTFAGVFALLALDALARLSVGGSTLARPLLASGDADRVRVQRVHDPRRDWLQVVVPRAARGDDALEAAMVAAALRRVLLLNQLPHALVLAMAGLACARLERPGLALAPVSAALLLLAFTLSQLCFGLGQRQAAQRALAALRGEAATGAQAALRQRVSALPPLEVWAAWLAAGALGAVAGVCAERVARGLIP